MRRPRSAMKRQPSIPVRDLVSRVLGSSLKRGIAFGGAQALCGHAVAAGLEVRTRRSAADSLAARVREWGFVPVCGVVCRDRRVE